MRFKTTLRFMVVLVLLLANAPIAAAQKETTKSPEQQSEEFNNIVAVENFIPRILAVKWSDPAKQALTLAKVAVPLWSRDKERSRETFETALKICKGIPAEVDQKKPVPCRQRIFTLIYQVDKKWFEELIAETTSGNPYSGVIDNLLQSGKEAEAADEIQQSYNKGFKAGLFAQLGALRAKGPKGAETADRLFAQFVKSPGPWDPAEILEMIGYPRNAGYTLLKLPPDRQIIFPIPLADSWNELGQETVDSIMAAALAARRDDKQMTYVMCKSMLSRALTYAPDMARSFTACMESFPDLGNIGSSAKGFTPSTDNFEQKLQDIAKSPDVRVRDLQYIALSLMTLRVGSVKLAREAADRVDDKSSDVAKQLAALLDFAAAGESLQKSDKTNEPDPAMAEKTADKLSGAKSAILWLAAAQVRKEQGGDLTQMHMDLRAALKAAKSIPGDMGPYLALNASVLALNADATLGFEYLAEAIKGLNKADPVKPVMFNEIITIPKVINISFLLTRWFKLDLTPVKAFLVFLKTDKERTLSEVGKLENEQLLAEIYPAFATELLP